VIVERLALIMPCVTCRVCLRVVVGVRANSLIKAVGFKSFAAAWANDTAATAPAPSSQWVGMLVANVTGKPTNLPAAAVEKLFSPNYTMSLLNTTWESTQVGHVQVWQHFSSHPARSHTCHPFLSGLGGGRNICCSALRRF